MRITELGLNEIYNSSAVIVNNKSLSVLLGILSIYIKKLCKLHSEF